MCFEYVCVVCVCDRGVKSLLPEWVCYQAVKAIDLSMEDYSDSNLAANPD